MLSHFLELQTTMLTFTYFPLRGNQKCSTAVNTFSQKTNIVELALKFRDRLSDDLEVKI